MPVRSCMAAVLTAQSPGAIAQDAIEAKGLSGPVGRSLSRFADRTFPTNVYFDDTPVQTMLSADAGGGDTRLSPRDSAQLDPNRPAHIPLMQQGRADTSPIWYSPQEQKT